MYVDGDRVAEDLEPPIERQLAERMRVQQLLCDLEKDLNPEKIVSRKILAINAQTAPASRQEPQTRNAKRRPSWIRLRKSLKYPPAAPRPIPSLSSTSSPSFWAKPVHILHRERAVCIRPTDSLLQTGFPHVGSCWESSSEVPGPVDFL